MKFTDEQFHEIFGKFLKPQKVEGYSAEDNSKWMEGYSFAFSQLYDDLVTNGVDEDDKFFDMLQKQKVKMS